MWNNVPVLYTHQALCSTVHLFRECKVLQPRNCLLICCINNPLTWKDWRLWPHLKNNFSPVCKHRLERLLLHKFKQFSCFAFALKLVDSEIVLSAKMFASPPLLRSYIFWMYSNAEIWRNSSQQKTRIIFLCMIEKNGHIAVSLKRIHHDHIITPTHLLKLTASAFRGHSK